MAFKSVFEFFEIIAEELCTQPSRVITSIDIKGKREESSSLLEDLKRDMGSSDTEQAIKRAVDELSKHFKDKGSKLPFSFDESTSRYTTEDADYLKFVTQMASIRSVGARARDFECQVAQRLELRATGAIHRVGFPRDTKKKRNDFITHLKELGFRQTILLGNEKDGGLDILWILPIGSIPHRPMLSVQCKNGEFNMDQADISVGTGSRTLSEHRGLMSVIHVPCVLFNDYVYPAILTPKQMNFVPLGLSDLASLDPRVSLHLI